MFILELVSSQIHTINAVSFYKYCILLRKFFLNLDFPSNKSDGKYSTFLLFCSELAKYKKLLPPYTIKIYIRSQVCEFMLELYETWWEGRGSRENTPVLTKPYQAEATRSHVLS